MEHVTEAGQAWDGMTERGYFKYWEDREKAFGLSRPEIINEYLQPTKDKAVLEVGCGYGRESVPLATLFGKFEGWDISAKVIAKAKGNIGTAQNMAFNVWPTGIGDRDKKFDCLYTYGTMQHCEDDVARALLTDAADRMKPGGLFIVEFQSYNGGALDQQHRSNGYVSLMRGQEAISPLLDAAGLVQFGAEYITLESNTEQIWVYGGLA